MRPLHEAVEGKATGAEMLQTELRELGCNAPGFHVVDLDDAVFEKLGTAERRGASFNAVKRSGGARCGYYRIVGDA